MNGILQIDKPEGISSAEVLRRLKKKVPRDVVLGHAGTLDPFATGLLLVLVGKAVKLAQYFLSSEKTYQGQILFGASSPTGDLTAPPSESTATIPSELGRLQTLAQDFTLSPYLQTPPSFSAKKKEGVRAYKLARLGLVVELEPVKRRVIRFDILNLNGALAEFEAQVESGTYIRVLAEDLAKKCGSLAYLQSLRRTASGPFSLSQASTVDTLLNSDLPWENQSAWIPFDQILSHWPSVEASQGEHLALVHGKQSVASSLFEKLNSPLPTRVAVFHEQKLVAILSQSPQPRIERVFT